MSTVTATSAPPVSGDMLTSALDWCAAGASVVRTATDGTKATLGRWTENMTTAADADTVTGWFANGHPGLGIVCGAVSGNLELLEVEGRAVLDGTGGRFLETLDACGLGELKQRILTGYSESSPSGGWHFFYRVDGAPVHGNTKLAQRHNPDPTAKPKVLTLIETRGEAGYAVVAPSHGPVHRSGRPWTLIAGGPSTIATITAEEHGALWEVARTFDEMPPPDPIPDPPTPSDTANGLRPGDDFNARATWHDVLVPAGWVAVQQRRDTSTLWRRPGKGIGVSAVTGGAGGDYMYVWTTSTELPSETAMSKWRVYTFLNHGRDFSAAAKALAAAGYGRRDDTSTRPPLTPLASPDPATTEPARDHRHGHPPGPPATSTPETESTPTTVDPSRYFDSRTGLLAAVLAADALAVGPLAQGTDDRLWSYQGGVWVPQPHVVRDRVVRLLNDRFRRSYATNAEDVIKASIPRITSEPVSQFINCRNGLLNWRTGQLTSHTPDVLSTVQLSVDWAPDATCPAFDQWLAQVVPSDCVGLMWELLGYLCYSGNPLHIAVMLVGHGRNGKGTFLRVVEAILGQRNITAVSLHDLMNTRFSTANLFGKIANIAGDIDSKPVENTAVFKQITGNDLMSAEHKGRDRFDFTPWCVPVFSANTIPASADTTVGYLSRWLVVPFPASFAGREDRTVETRLHTELPGVLAKAVRHLPRLLERGHFELTGSAQRARIEFERNVDQVRTWLDECTKRGQGLPFEKRGTLHTAYKCWALRDGHKPLTASEFYARLETAGVESSTIHGTRGFKGITITDTAGALLPP